MGELVELVTPSHLLNRNKLNGLKIELVTPSHLFNRNKLNGHYKDWGCIKSK
jgi:hypothetical protein